MNIDKLMQKYSLEHGLEVDQRHLDAFVKELEQMVAFIINMPDLYNKPSIFSEDDIKALRREALNLFFNNQ